MQLLKELWSVIVWAIVGNGDADGFKSEEDAELAELKDLFPEQWEKAQHPPKIARTVHPDKPIPINEWGYYIHKQLGLLK